jgi:C-terminal processing protease CtpA/Prc
MQREMRRRNSGFVKLERLPGNVGYLDLRGFMDHESGAETVAAAMNFLANTDALILDLRKNGGGSPHMVQLICSYLFAADKPVHLNSLYWREGDRTEEFWTLKDLSGHRYLGKDVYVLTSRLTFSGAEECAYNLQTRKRATLVGETTGGGAHPGKGVLLGEHFRAFISTGRAINPVTKTNWEGTGVRPDVATDAERALDVAHELALKKLKDSTTDPEVREGIEEELRGERMMEKRYKERKSR